MTIMVLIMLLLLLLEIKSICALRGYDLQYCDDPTSIDKVEPSQEFPFEVYMDDFYIKLNGYEMSLACCAPKGSKIEWLFNNRILKESESSFCELSNDTRYIISTNITKKVGYENTNDKGIYKCIVSNDKYERPQEKKFKLFVYNKIWVNRARYAQNLHSVGKKVKHGQTATLRSSHHLGFWSKNNIPNITAEWISNSPYYTAADLNNKDVKKTRLSYAAGGSVNLISLTSVKVNETFFKDLPEKTIQFECIIKAINGTLLHNNSYKIEIVLYVEPPDPTRKYKITIASIVIFVVLNVILISLIVYNQIEIRLMIKDRFGSLNVFDGKKNDVFVCSNFHTKTSEQEQSYCIHAIFVYKMLVPHLENTLGYSCYNHLRDTVGGEWLPESLLQQLQSSRRFVLVLCDGLLEDPVCKLVCHAAVNEALTRKLPIICILPRKSQRKGLLEKCLQSNSAMHSILSVAHKVTWPGKDAAPKECSQFWKTLRLYMPPRRENLYLSIEINYEEISITHPNK